MSRRPRLVFVVTTPVTADVLLKGQLAFLRESGFDITVISSPGPELARVAEREGVHTVGIEIAREIEPAADAVSLVHLVRALRKIQPDIVNASTAKGGLLGMAAAAIVGVPIRIYLQRGLRMETAQGVKRRVLALAETAVTAAAHHVICVSESLRRMLVEEGFGRREKYSVLGCGSSNGIDVDRFARTAERLREAAELRRSLRIPDDAPVIGFIGRPVADKGISELLDAFALIKAEVPDARLLFIGAGFGDYEVGSQIAARLQQRDIISVGRVAEPAPYYATMDVLAFPSRREGLPNAPLEAAACGVPTVAMRATGVTDAIIDGETGQIVEQGDTRAFAHAIVRYVGDPRLRTAHGERARARVVERFSGAGVWSRWRDEYVRLLRLKGLPLPEPQRLTKTGT